MTAKPIPVPDITRDEARRIAANTAKLPRHRLKPSNFHFGIEPIRLGYIFAYTSLICDGHHQKHERDTNLFVC